MNLAVGDRALGKDRQVAGHLEIDARIERIALVGLGVHEIADQRRGIVVPLVEAGLLLQDPLRPNRVLRRALIRGRGGQVREDRQAFRLRLRAGRQRHKFARRQRRAVGRGAVGERHVGRIGAHRGRVQAERLFGRIVEIEQPRIVAIVAGRVLEPVAVVLDLGIGPAGDHAQAVVQELARRDAAEVGSPVLAQRVLAHAAAHGEIRLAEIQAGAGLDLDAAAQRPFGHVGGRTLDDIDALDDFGGQFAQIGATARRQRVGRLNADAVEFDAGQVGAVAADRDAITLAEFVAAERDTRHARDGFVDVAIGERADVVGDDRVGRGLRVLLAVVGRLLAGARSDDDDVGGDVVGHRLAAGRLRRGRAPAQQQPEHRPRCGRTHPPACIQSISHDSPLPLSHRGGDISCMSSAVRQIFRPMTAPAPDRFSLCETFIHFVELA